VNYCPVHPAKEATLKCNKCERYMCVQCAIQTPVGYRCKECVRGIQEKYYTAANTDNLVVAAVCGVLSFLAGLAVSWVGFIFIVLILAIPAGGLIAEAALRIIKRRRGRHMAIYGAVATAVCALIPMTFTLLRFGVFVPDISLLLFAGMAAFAVYGRIAMRS
jgi:B-box zinc finger